MFEHTKCIVFTNIINLLSNIFTLNNITLSDLYTIYNCTPLQCQREEPNQEWLNQPPIQLPLHRKSPFQNIYHNIGSSYVGDECNNIEVGMDDFLQDSHVMDKISLHVF